MTTTYVYTDGWNQFEQYNDDVYFVLEQQLQADFVFDSARSLMQQSVGRDVVLLDTSENFNT